MVAGSYQPEGLTGLFLIKRSMLFHKTGGFIPTCSAACAPRHETPSPEGICFQERSHIWLAFTGRTGLQPPSGLISQGTAQVQDKAIAWCALRYIHLLSLYMMHCSQPKRGKKKETGTKVTEKKLLWPSKASPFLFQTTGSVMTPPFNSVELISIHALNFCYLKPFLPLIKLIAVPVPATDITSY